jgi:hypothetical protein
MFGDMLLRLVMLSVASMAVACGGSTPTADSPDPENEAQGAELSPPDEQEATAPEAEPSATGAADAKADKTETEGREIKYIVTPEGLEVEVAGVRFHTGVKPVQMGGGWGVRVSATAKSKDGRTHSLSSPKRGPIALAGNIKRRGQTERFSDQREGDDEQTIEATTPLEISREWPAKGEKPLRDGDELDLEVGLWGLGDDAASRRPVRDFFRVRMVVGKKKPQPVVMPPPTGKE